jgi:feruloyl esterase
MKRRLLLVGSAVGLFATIAIGPMPAAATPCTNLNHLRLKDTTITSAEDNTTGMFTVPKPNPPIILKELPAFCRVTATLTPMSDSTIKIEVWLPETTWNGRFLGTGGGGFGGVFTLSSYRDELAAGIMKGFATANSDLGTGSSGCTTLLCGSANPPSTGLFGHPERIKDFGYRAIHLMTVRGKEIVQHFYKQNAQKAYFKQNAQKAYFAGCSTGGQNALMEAQRFPEDYNGILAGDAAFNRTHLHMAGLALWQDTATPDRLKQPFIQPGQMTLINEAVLAPQCVGQDGGATKDRFLTDPRDCQFNPNVLQCTAPKVPPLCLSKEQVATMTKYYDGLKDPQTGEVIYPGSERGNETDDISVGGLAFQERLPEPVYDGLFYWVFGKSFGYPNSAINYTNFDFHNDIDKVDDALAEPLNAVSTDLSDFKQRGSKLIMYHGWADTVIPSQSSINYFNALVRHESQDDDGVQQARFEPDGDNNLRKTQQYARLFMVPGMYHCQGGPGPNVFDALTPLVNWVENGVAPDRIIATKFVADTPPAVQMTRPLCVFPKVAKWDGIGDPKMETSFACVADEPDFNQTPAPKYGP